MDTKHAVADARARTLRVAATFSLLAIVGVVPVLAHDPGPGERAQWRELQRGDRQRAGGKPAPSPASRYRSFDGLGNNLLHPRWGSAGSNYLRERSGADYADGRSSPAGAGRHSARVISNAIADQGVISTQDERGLSTSIYEFGQFLDHDIGLAQGGSSEGFDIAVPTGDPFFDPMRTGGALIYMDRSAFDPATGVHSPREQINTVTSFIDASHIYGSDAVRAAWLRTFTGGRLKVRDTAAGVLLPLNDGTQANDNPVGAPATSLSVAGDVRANEQTGLTVLHIAFLREHNRQAGRLAALHRDWDDERLYQEARRIVGATMQVITYNEFLPALLGRPLPPYRGYRASVNSGLSNTFATAAYRFGHSQVGPDLGVLDEDFVEVDSIELSDLFFNPGVIPYIGGIEPVIRYMAVDHAQAVDSTIVGGLRNFLFGAPGAGGFDLASLNIQRGRDHGIPSYNRVRADFGLRPVRSFNQITSNAERAATLGKLYSSVSNVDAWVGMLAEDHAPGSSLGPTAAAVITDQFVRLRDGDRFWYQAAGFEPAELAMIEQTRLADLLERNSTVAGLQPKIFFVPCAADFNHSGTVDVQDILDFMSALSAGRTSADFDGNGVIDQQDLVVFLSEFNADCR